MLSGNISVMNLGRLITRPKPPIKNITFSGDNTYSGTANFTSTVTMSGTKNFTGTTNLAGLVFSTSGITFADGTSQTTAATSQAFAISMAVALG